MLEVNFAHMYGAVQPLETLVAGRSAEPCISLMCSPVQLEL